jgi:hypothetical protein
MIIPENLKDHNVIAFFTYRQDGVDRKVISRLSGIPAGKIFFPLQRHTDRIINISGAMPDTVADSVITNEVGVLLGTKVADCVPILLYDPARRVVAATHAGWRGTAGGILGKTIKVLAERYNSLPDDIIISMGPSIRWCCYRVGAEVFEAVRSATGEGEYHILRDGGICLDLPSANRVQALREGVPEENIWISEDCTFCYPERYNSYRYDGTGKRQGGFIGLKP